MSPLTLIPLALVILILLFSSSPTITLARKLHSVAFKSPNLYPEGLAWDPVAQHFLAGSLRRPEIVAVSDAGVVETLISDSSLPANASFLGLAVDSTSRRLLAVVGLPGTFSALAAYDLLTRRRIFLATFPDPDSRPNDVAVDYDGNAYVTDSALNAIWLVNAEGEASIFSRSAAFTAHPVDRDAPYSYCGLNGVVYISKGYLLVVQSNTGKMFKVRTDDGTARLVPLTEDLTLADDIAVRRDGVVVVVSSRTAWFLKSDDSWGRGAAYDKTALDAVRFSTSVAVAEDRVYALYGHVEEGMMGIAEREWFGIEEIRAEKETEEENIWVYVLIGLGLAYFMFWRLQMGQLVKTMNKKTA